MKELGGLGVEPRMGIAVDFGGWSRTVRVAVVWRGGIWVRSLRRPPRRPRFLRRGFPVRLSRPISLTPSRSPMANPWISLVLAAAAAALASCASSGASTPSGAVTLERGGSDAAAPAGESHPGPSEGGAPAGRSLEEILTAEAAELPRVTFLRAFERVAPPGSGETEANWRAAIAELKVRQAASETEVADVDIRFQGKPREESGETKNFGNDLTRPLTRIDLGSNFVKQQGSRESVILTPQVGIPIDLDDSTSKLNFRVLVPFLLGTNRISRDNPDGDWKTGFGDLAAEIAYVRHEPGQIGFAIGGDFVFPTATSREMGQGKYLFAPLLGASYLLPDLGPDSYVAIFLRDFFSYAEEYDSQNVHELSIEPQFQWQFADHWYVLVNPNMVINWRKDGRMFLPLTTSVGTMIAGHFRIAAEGSIALVNDYDLYQWYAGFTLTYFF